MKHGNIAVPDGNTRWRLCSVFFSQGDRGLPGERGPPGQKGVGEPGAKVRQKG